MQKEVSACFEKVREYQAEEARKEKERADREAQDKKDAADEAARRKQARDTRDAQDKKRAADRAAQEKADQTAAEAAEKEESDRNAALQNQARPAPPLAPTRQATPPNSRANERRGSSSALVDPFNDSGGSKSQRQETASNLSMVDPFATADKLVDPFPHSGRTPEETWDGAKEIFQGFVDKGADSLGDILKSARKELSPQDYKRFEHTVGDAHSFLTGFSKTLTVVQYGSDIRKVYENPKDTDSYHDIISDGASHGFSYVLQRISPDFLSKLWEGPIGWGLAITFDSSSTQTVKQDFDPMNALNNPGQFSFQQREAALQSLYQSAQKHPEIWDQKRYQWLYSVSERLYNSPDNPNIHLTPP
jgi:chemotaxis protein histidine kinase CheA